MSTADNTALVLDFYTHEVRPSSAIGATIEHSGFS